MLIFSDFCLILWGTGHGDLRPGTEDHTERNLSDVDPARDIEESGDGYRVTSVEFAALSSSKKTSAARLGMFRRDRKRRRGVSIVLALSAERLRGHQTHEFGFRNGFCSVV